MQVPPPPPPPIYHGHRVWEEAGEGQEHIEKPEVTPLGLDIMGAGQRGSQG